MEYRKLFTAHSVLEIDDHDGTMIDLVDIKMNSPRERHSTVKSPPNQKRMEVNDSEAASSVRPVYTENASRFSGRPEMTYRHFKRRVMRTLKISLVICCVLAATSAIVGVWTCI